MKRVITAAALALLALASGAARAATPTPTPTNTPTATPTPKQGASVSSIDLCYSLAAGATGDCGYFTWAPGKAQDPSSSFDILNDSTSNACVLLWWSFPPNYVTREILTPTCLAAGASVHRSVPGRGVRLGVTVATTPTPNATPPHVSVVPNGDGLIQVYPATPTPVP